MFSFTNAAIKAGSAVSAEHSLSTKTEDDTPTPCTDVKHALYGALFNPRREGRTVTHNAENGTFEVATEGPEGITTQTFRFDPGDVGCLLVEAFREAAAASQTPASPANTETPR